MPTYQANGGQRWATPRGRAIFERLAERPRAVGELVGELPVSRPAVSQHLKVLKEARLVVDQPAGTRRIYRLDPDGVGALRADLDRFRSIPGGLQGGRRATRGGERRGEARMPEEGLEPPTRGL